MLGLEVFIWVVCVLLLWLTFIKGGGAFVSLVSMYCYFFAAMYLLRHLILMLGLDTPMPDEYFNFDVTGLRVYAVFNVLVWTIFFLLAIYCVKKNVVLEALFPRAPLVVNETRLMLVVVCLFLFNLFITMHLLYRYDFNFALISYGVRVEKIFSGLSFLLSVHVFAAYTAACAAFYFYLQRKAGTGLGRRFYFLSALAFLSIFTSVLTGDRDNIVFFFVFYFLSLCIYISPKFKHLFLPFALCAMWLLILMQKTRLASWGFEKEYSSLFRQISSGLNHQFYDSYMLLVAAISNDWFLGEGFRLGKDFYLGVVGVIPRILWSGKPIMVDPGIWFSNKFINDATYGWPVSVVGEWWLNFNVLGVAFGAFVSGAIYSVLSNKYQDFVFKPFAWLLLFFICTRIFPLGYSASTPMYYMLNLVPLLIIYKFIARRV
jgi:hypothetical protein